MTQAKQVPRPPRPARAPIGTLGFLIYDVARLLRRAGAAIAARDALPHSQWRALLHLSRMQGCRQNELADVLEVRPVSLGRVVDQLESAGLVVRRPDPSDRRARRLYLTPKAEPMLRRLQTLGDAVRERALAGVPAGREAALIDSLERMRANLQRGRELRNGRR
jgi:DNA-binding MarR family transcriptional regulator